MGVVSPIVPMKPKAPYPGAQDQVVGIRRQHPEVARQHPGLDEDEVGGRRHAPARMIDGDLNGLRACVSLARDPDIPESLKRAPTGGGGSRCRRARGPLVRTVTDR
jgi:hypothetical protein